MKPFLWILVGVALTAGGFGLFRWVTAPSADEPYAPSASEVPLTVDYEVAVEKLVRPENYRKELARIDNELNLLSRTEQEKKK